MTDETTTEETPTLAVEATTPDETPGVGQGDETPDTFPRDYVENLRKENADYRTRAKTADDLAKRLGDDPTDDQVGQLADSLTVAVQQTGG